MIATVALMALASVLIDPPAQEDVFRRMASPATDGPIPEEVETDADLVAVAVPHQAGVVGAALFPRRAAAQFVAVEREIVERGGEEAQAAERERCRRDRFWFLSRWVDLESKFPLGQDRTVPFLPFVYQVKIVRLYDRAREERKGIFLDKSRQLGLSWLWMGLYLHGLLFEDQTSFFATSHKQDEVDDGGAGSTTDSLFGRLRFMYNQLPPFLRDVPGTTTPALRFKHLQISHVTSEAFLAGEAATDNIARGSSYEVGLLDEFAHVERSESAWASADDAIAVPILSSTPQGEANKFAHFHRMLSRPKSDSEKEVRSRFLAHRAHWSEHPIYARDIERDQDGKLTSPWYRRATATKTSEKAAAEYDIAYAGSLPGRYIPEFRRGVHVPEEPIALNTGYGFYLSADHGLSDTEVWGLWQTDGRYMAELVDEWHTVPEGEHHGEDLTSAEVAEGVLRWLHGWGLSLARIEAVFPDPSGASRDQTSGQSHHDLLLRTWARNGQYLRDGAWIPANNEFAEGVESTRLLFKGTWQGNPFDLRISPRCTLVVDSLLNYRRRITRDGRVLDQELQDWTNHGADMVRYFAHTLFPAIGDVPVGGEEESYTTAGRGRI